MRQTDCNTRGGAPVTYAIRPAVTEGETIFRLVDTRRRLTVAFYASLSRAQAVLRVLEQGAEDGEAGSWR